jgi:hypothetical protein
MKVACAVLALVLRHDRRLEEAPSGVDQRGMADLARQA